MRMVVSTDDRLFGSIVAGTEAICRQYVVAGDCFRPMLLKNTAFKRGGFRRTHSGRRIV